ncbi:MAG: lysylphosphatidylglycerol synthase transmembrane domain-containing protein [Cryomorphaceae bacterium]|nr:flippase-like domain-containing protein [Flavobacteriales bacterium]
MEETGAKKKQRIHPYLKLAIKIGLSALAMWVVFRKVELTEVWELVRQSNVSLLLLALVLFNVSKWLSAYRLQAILKAINIDLGMRFHMQLCYVGMFYNLFLPGSVGGDGYKVVYLNKRFPTGLRLLVASMLYDRASGGAVLLSMAFAFGIFVTPYFDWFPEYSNLMTLIFAGLCIPALFLGTRLVFPSFWSARYPVLLWSVGVQGVQVLCAYAILLAFGVSELFMLYFVLFLASSLASMLPVSFGGVGLRELVFVYAAQYLPIDETPAVSLGMMYFVVIALSSFVGIFIKLPENTPAPAAS